MDHNSCHVAKFTTTQASRSHVSDHFISLHEKGMWLAIKEAGSEPEQKVMYS